MTDRIRNLILLSIIRAACRLTTWRRDSDRMPTGIPTLRDPDARCAGFAPRRRTGCDWDCRGDGHYLCSECAHHVTEETSDV